MMTSRTKPNGFTLVEVILVIIIAGILATVAMKSAGEVSETSRVEQTKQELDALSIAIVGNPQLESNGVRTDFGYVGDIGAMPPNLDALVSNPGGYSTWNGPYIKQRFSQISDDHRKDAWGADYAYTGGVNITSSGSGSDIVRKFGRSTDELLYNTVSGTVLGNAGSPPGITYRDSVFVRLIAPNGTGGLTIRTNYVGLDGYFSFDSLPIGNHDLELIYIPDDDTLRRFVSILPGSSPYSVYPLATSDWIAGSGGGGDLTHVPGSDTTYGVQCRDISFWMTNTSATDVTISSITLTWSTPTAYYRSVIFNGTMVVDENNPHVGSGETATFSAAQTVIAGASVKMQVEIFKANPTGGANVDMSNTIFAVLLSDGTTFDMTSGSCP